MYFVLSLNIEQVDRAAFPSALLIHLRRPAILQKEQASETHDLSLGQGTRILGAAFQTTCAK